jgi:hypothetical protein
MENAAEVIFQYTGIIVLWSLAIGLAAILGSFLVEIFVNNIWTKFETAWKCVEYVYYRREFKEWVKTKERLTRFSEKEEKAL